MLLLNERLKILKENKIKEKEILLKIKNRKFIEALVDIDESVDRGLRCDETIFNCDVSSVKVAQYLGFKSKAIGFNKATFKITQKGLKKLNKMLIKYNIGGK